MPGLVTTGAPILRAPLAVLALLWLGMALGRRMLRWLGASHGAPTLEGFILAIALGVGVLEIVPLGLGAAGLLSVVSVRWAIAGMFVLALPDIWALVGDVRSAFERRARPPSWLLAWMLALAPGLVAIALVALTPAIDPDGLGYHLTVP